MTAQKKIFGKYVVPDGPRFTALRTAKGMTVEDLAAKAICSTKTISRLEKSTQALLSTVNRFPPILDVPLSELVASPKLTEVLQQPTTNITEDHRVLASIRLLIRFEDFDETDQLMEFIEKFIERVGTKATIEVQLVRSGSVVIELISTIGDGIRAIAAMDREELDSLLVAEITFSLDVATCPPGKNYRIVGSEIVRLFDMGEARLAPFEHVERFSRIDKVEIGTVHYLNAVLIDRLAAKGIVPPT